MVTGEGELEPLTPEGWAADPAAAGARDSRRPGRLSRPSRQSVVLSVVAAVLVLVVVGTAKAYMGQARSAVRTLEQDRALATRLTEAREAEANRLLSIVVNADDLPMAQSAVRALLVEHRAKALALAHRAQRVRVVDHGVRGLRSAVVGALVRDAHDLDHYAKEQDPPTQPVLGHAFPYADGILAKQLRRWHLRPESVPPPRPTLHSADAARAQLSRWVDKPNGARLLVAEDNGLALLDVDQSKRTEVYQTSWRAVAGRSFAAVVEGGRVTVIDVDHPSPPAGSVPLNASDDDAVLVPSADGLTVLVQPFGGGRVVQVGADGTQPRPAWPASMEHGRLLADAGTALVWAPVPPDIDFRFLADAIPTTIVVSDKATGRIVRRLTVSELLAASQAGLAWRDRNGRLRVTDVAGHDLGVPDRGSRSVPVRAAFSPDGRTLAVLWDDLGRGGIDLIALGSAPAVRSTVAVSPTQVHDLRWTVRSDLLFLGANNRCGFVPRDGHDITWLRLRGNCSIVGAF
ncbi:MAG: hypothetical protein QOK43_1829 [Acidimicrobiaceae bacterium]|nr:hypothetical protein [Acidimicrobiaceae bacterium]